MPVVRLAETSLKRRRLARRLRTTSNRGEPHAEAQVSCLGATLAIASIGAFAQAAAPATPRVDARETKQEARINAGVASGQLTPRETKRLEKQQGHVEAVETRAKADGTVTAGERRHLAKVQTRSSANVYQQKHDAQVVPPMTVKP